MATKSKTAERIKEMRLLHNMTQVQLAKRAGLTGDWICQCETGSRAPTVTTLRKLATALHVSLAYLLGDDLKPLVNSTNHHKKRKVKSNGHKNARASRNGR